MAKKLPEAELDRMIPPDLYEAVADPLAHLLDAGGNGTEFNAHLFHTFQLYIRTKDNTPYYYQ